MMSTSVAGWVSLYRPSLAGMARTPVETGGRRRMGMCVFGLPADAHDEKQLRAVGIRTLPLVSRLAR